MEVFQQSKGLDEHGGIWLRYCFEVTTKETANGKRRLIICEGHDSHLSDRFMSYCHANNIAVFLLLLYLSHLIQLLNVSIFSPLKAAIKLELNALFQTGIVYLYKSQRIEKYMKAREKAMIKKNILAGRWGSGLWQINYIHLLSQIPEPDTSTPSTNQQISNTLEVHHQMLWSYTQQPSSWISKLQQHQLKHLSEPMYVDWVELQHNCVLKMPSYAKTMQE